MKISATGVVTFLKQAYWVATLCSIGGGAAAISAYGVGRWAGVDFVIVKSVDARALDNPGEPHR